MNQIINKIFNKIFKAAMASKAFKQNRLQAQSLASMLENESQTWENVKRSAIGGKRILIATSMGCYEHGTLVESALSIALTLRGARVSFLLCDQSLPCCQMIKIYNIAPEDLLTQEHTPRCDECVKQGEDAFQFLGLPILRFGDWISDADADEACRLSESLHIEDIPKYVYREVAVGEHAMAGALRFFARGDLEDEPFGEKILRRYLKASMLTASAMGNVLAKHRFDAAVFNHGIYVPQGIIGEVLRREGIRVVNWNPSYRKQTFIFSHDDTYHRTMITEPTNLWERMPWDFQKEKVILDYLKSRRYGTQDWIWFHDKPYEDLDRIQQELGIDFNEPCIGLLTSVMWDAQLHYRSNAFRNMLEWMVYTIEYFRKRPDLKLLARIHPAEIHGLIPSRQKMLDAIQQRIQKYPPNITLVPPESRISTYALMQKCNAVIIYNTKTGIEISCMGIPVIVAGEAWIRGKGFSIDVNSPEEYLEVLDRLPLPHRLSPEQLLRARKYAYHFFFRRMIELPFLVPIRKHKIGLMLNSLRQLEPGVFPGLDVVCRGILDGSPFIVEKY
ncbi:MAG: hypothetical protein WHT06_03215 [Desulfobacterales bacterium]